VSTPSPLQPFYQSVDAMMLPFGEGVQIVGQLDAIELEYAAIRKHAALFDSPHRGLLRLTGKDRLDFLHRMTTHDCRSLVPGSVRRMFLLNAKGRIMADMLAVHAADQTLLDLDVHSAAGIAEELDKLLFGEDVKIENLSQSHHRVSLHGPRAPEVSRWWREITDGVTSWDFREDETGEVGIHIWSTPEAVVRFANDAEALAERFGLRHIGWLAFNIARIEAGRPMFRIDFGPDSLPHETGLLKETVSFTKGCYRGQEIVARMENLGHPAKMLVGFRAEAEPVAGAAVYDKPGAESAIVGAVTSSTFSPMNSQTPVGFAMLKWGKHTPGSVVYSPAEGKMAPLTVVELPFYKRPSA
jgi:folate-binding protein YgfZ